ncbi:MAG: hypothetical protein N3E50_06660, partial [Candidatus Goldbacteria bacterium]|nr:hypothetical protein [Candidatus Goldiibacteriota bacterium]
MVSKSSKKKSAFQKIRKTVNQEKVNVIKEQTMNKSFNKNIFIIVIVLFVIFFAGEIYYVTKKS